MSRADSILSKSRTMLAVGQDFLRASRLMDGGEADPRFRDIEKYCMFVGTPRSGHSLVGALLDAHPEAIVAHELDALKLVHARFGRARIYALILERSRSNAALGPRSGRYSYKVPDQWQGRYTKLRVIGDKKAWGSTLRVRKTPWLVTRLRSITGVPLRFVHVVRNPFDNIATMAIRAAGERPPDLERAGAEYFSLCETVDRLEKGLAPGDLWRVHHERFLADPQRGMAELTGWLDLGAPPDYLAACASIVRRSPHHSREEVDWPPPLRLEVERRCREFKWLADYQFDD